MIDVISLIFFCFELSLMVLLKIILYSIFNVDYFLVIFFIDVFEFNC